MGKICRILSPAKSRPACFRRSKEVAIVANEAQQQLEDQRARNLADQAADENPEPTEAEVTDGRFAYAAYGAESGAGTTTWDGRPMPTWNELGDRQRAGYIAIARALAARGR
jgi:hypothetical protein